MKDGNVKIRSVSINHTKVKIQVNELKVLLPSIAGGRGHLLTDLKAHHD